MDSKMKTMRNGLRTSAGGKASEMMTMMPPPPRTTTPRRRQNVEEEKENRRRKQSAAASSTTSLSGINIGGQIKVGATKTIQSVKTTFDTLSQKLRLSTRRRCRFGERSKSTRNLYGEDDDNVPGPSPVKLYSPFGIDTPTRRRPALTSTAANGPPGKFTPKRRARCCRSFNSPSQSFHVDVEAVRQGSKQLNALATGIASAASKKQGGGEGRRRRL